jgi:formylglycine-generating enzyme required for sulfatase activity
MVGGVWEFCQDWYDPEYYATAPARDPQGPASGQLRVHRGGSWLEANLSTRPAFRHGTDPTWRNPRHGFRCAQDLIEDKAPDAATSSSGPEARAARAVTVFARIVPVAGEGRAVAACAASWELAPGAKAAFRGSFGQAHPDVQRPWKAAGGDARCDQGGTPGAIPYLVADLSLTLLSSPGARHDLAAMVTVRRLTGFSAAGQAIYTDAVQHRTFSLEPGDAGIVPLLFSSPTEARDLGVDHVSLYVGVRDDAHTPARYGAISIRADAAGADVFLDGGRVARMPEEKLLTLWNVPAGDTEVSLRGGAGLEAKRLVTVSADRRVLVALGSARSFPAPPNALAPMGANHRGYEEYRRQRDDAVMVKVPAGEFLMGNLETEGRPAPHTVRVSSFLMDKDPMTWERYERFLEATGRPLPPHEPYWGILPDHPAVFVTWEEARAYCEWVGGRLPTEAEREKAARGTDARRYPWGNEEPRPDLAIFRRNWGSAAPAAV